MARKTQKQAETQGSFGFREYGNNLTRGSPMMPEQPAKRDYKDSSTKQEDLEAFWRDVAQTALPERARGHILTKELLNWFKALRKTSYPIKGYSNMNHEELFNYYVDTRRDIWQNARIHCPDIADKINQTNAFWREQQRLLRSSKQIR